MGDIINKEFDKFQEELKKSELKLKYITKFPKYDKLDDIIEELKKKEIEL